MPNKKEGLTLEEKGKIEVMVAEGRSYHAIGQILDRSPHTIKKHACEPTAQRNINEIREELAAFFEDLARRMLVSITDEDIKKLSAYQRTVSSAIATDKARLLQGQSTENISMIHELVLQSKKRIADYEEMLRKYKEDYGKCIEHLAENEK